jgi:hypothetical protein
MIPENQESADKALFVPMVWRTITSLDREWERGAMDAYLTNRPQSTNNSYLYGYAAQLKALPTDADGNVEWFRYRPDGGWKLTDNI